MLRSVMSFRTWTVLGPVLLFAFGCGAKKAPETPPSNGTSSEPSSSADSTDSSAAPEDPTGPMAVPMTCHDGASPCTADPKWVKRLCQDVYPALGLYLNGPDSPFTRAYLSRKTKAVNASGGATSGEEWLRFDEQVVLIYHRKPPAGGLQVSGAEGGFDALRWDGSCVTLDGAEVRMEAPPQPLQSNIDWRYLGEDIQDALKAVDSVKGAYIARKKECKGAYSGDVSKECEKRDATLRKAIVDAVQSGQAKLPVPSRRP
jgi:hypothetical protein